LKLLVQFCQLGFDADGPAVASQAVAACALHAGVVPLRKRRFLEASFACARQDALFMKGSFVNKAPTHACIAPMYMCVYILVSKTYCAEIVQQEGLVILTKALTAADYAKLKCS